MFEGFMNMMKEREKRALSNSLQKRLRHSRNELKRRKDVVEHERMRLEREMESLMSEADRLTRQGNVDAAIMRAYEASEKDKALKSVNETLQVLSFYDGKLGVMQTRILSKDTVSKIGKSADIITPGMARMVERLASLDGTSHPYNDVDMNHLERMLDGPVYNPAVHDTDYQATRSSLETLSAHTPMFSGYLSNFKSKLIPVKER